MASPRSHSFMFQSLAADHPDYISSTSFNISSCPPPLYFHDGVGLMMKRSMSFSEVENSSCGEVNGEEGLSDDGLGLGEKKKRLNIEQVRALEKSFELGNKLEPERKIQLAKALNLQPRQIAIWFQNRRARWKTKQLERDYDLLKKQFQALKADNDLLHSQNTKLNAQLLAIKSKDSRETRSLKKENDQGSWSNNGSENSCDINIEISKKQAISSPSSSQLGIKELFPSAFRSQFLHSSSRPDLHCPKLEPHHPIQEEAFSQIFNGIDEHQAAAGLWPWNSDHNGHFH